MENKTLKFKTSLNCNGCVSKVQANLDQAEGISKWGVDLENPDKILTVQSDGITELEIITIIESKGFKAEPVS